MKLATYKDGSRDGQLVVVSRDLSAAHYATGVANHLQQVLDDWNFLSPQLQDLSDTLNHGKARHAFAFDPRMCMAPLPRAYQWAEGFAYPSLESTLHAASKSAAPATVDAELRMVQLASDDFLGPCDDFVCASDAYGIDLGAELAVITGDIPMGCAPERALDGIRLMLLANRLTLRHPTEAEQVSGRASLHGRPATAFGPVAVTLDELGDAWAMGRATLQVQSRCNGQMLGQCDAGPEMRFHFGQLIAHLAKTRRLRCGTAVGAGVISNEGVTVNGRTSWPRGSSCIAEKRAIDILQTGLPGTDYMKFGDTLRIEARGRDGQSLFGAIEQEIAPCVA